ncbi:bcl-2-like protein 12 [Girardinichthys multiradiatus]|nr:bcl-2-like protein 12 [Girardinichthys multiradiatus]XP_047215716.1 bcl-2-like protein 12 [Girardinichthys multiradiatus]
MQKDGYDSQPDKEDETKTGFKDRMKNFPRTSILSGRGSLGKSSKAKQSHQTEDSVSPSSSSDEDESEKKRKQRQVNMKKKIASLFKKNLKVSKEQNDSHPQRPSDLPSGKKRERPPDFYEEIAKKLEKLIEKSPKIKAPSPEPELGIDELAQKFAKLLCSEGDNMDRKIRENPELVSKLSGIRYKSFEYVLDTWTRSLTTQAPHSRQSSSPTLHRIAVSMELTRRMVTATGTQRLEGYAVRYMDNFVPWIKSNGGWEKVLSPDWTEEWD